MPDMLIRGLSEETIKRFKARAKRNGRSLQSEAKMLIEDAARSERIAEVLDRARQWRDTLGGDYEDSTELIREDRER